MKRLQAIFLSVFRDRYFLLLICQATVFAPFALSVLRAQRSLITIERTQTNYVSSFFQSIISSICRTTGLYTKTLAKIIRQDVTRFMVVFAVVFLSFCGSLFLSLHSSTQSQQFRCVHVLYFASLTFGYLWCSSFTAYAANDNGKKKSLVAFIRVNCGLYNLVSRVFVPLDQWSENESSGSSHLRHAPQMQTAQ